MKSSSLVFRIITASILAAFLLVAWPAPPAQAAVVEPSSIASTACAGTGYMRSLFLDHSLTRGDDITGGPFPLGFTINYFGVNYSNVYVNTNGHIDFGGPASYYVLTNGMTDAYQPSIAAFNYDADTTPVGSPNLVYFDQVMVDGHQAFATYWGMVGYYSQHLDLLNDFMVLIISRPDRGPGEFDIEFNFRQIQHDSYGRATIGFADGQVGTDDFNFLGSRMAGYFIDSNLSTGVIHTAVNSPNCGQWVIPVFSGLPAVERWHPVSLLSVGCNSQDITFNTDLSNVAFPTNLHFRTLVDAGSIRYMDEDAGNPGSNGLYGWNLYYSSSGGPALNAWPIPPNTPITVQFQLIDGPFGLPVTNYEIHLNRCNGGTIMPAFTDVAPGYWGSSWIYRLASAGITSGCNASPLMYCPSSTVTRAQMAKFLELGMRGAGYTPPPGTGLVFADVPASYWAAGWIERLGADGITSGCGTFPLIYCPEQDVTRDQMAVFLLKAKHGAFYIPPPAVGIFADVPTSYWAASWIEQLFAEGVTTGCGSFPLVYCPDYYVTRTEMAVFLVRNFNLP